MLVGVPTCGSGRGFEVSQGGDKYAIIDVTFELTHHGFKMNDISVANVQEGYFFLSQTSFLLSTMEERSEKENRAWRLKQKHSMPTYWTLCRLERNEIHAALRSCCIIKCLETIIMFLMKPFILLAVFFGLGHVLTKVGRTTWRIVAWKYYKFLGLTVGIWTEDLVEMYQIHEHIRNLSIVWEKPFHKKSAAAYNEYVYVLSGLIF